MIRELFVLRACSSAEASDAGEVASGNFYPWRMGSLKCLEVYTPDALVALWLRGCGPVCTLSLVYSTCLYYKPPP